jgi:hypothetical protein
LIHNVVPAGAEIAVVPSSPRTTVQVVPETTFTVIVSPLSPPMQSDATNGVGGTPALLATLIDVWNADIADARVVEALAYRKRYIICVPDDIGEVLGQNPIKFSCS